jgi:hypothetical protein
VNSCAILPAMIMSWNVVHNVQAKVTVLFDEGSYFLHTILPNDGNLQIPEVTSTPAYALCCRASAAHGLDAA